MRSPRDCPLFTIQVSTFVPTESVCPVCVCFVIPFVLNVRVVDVPAGVTQEEDYTGSLHLTTAGP